jgi:hypothetical protein
MRTSTLAAVVALSTVSAAPAFAMNGYAEKLTFVSELRLDGEKMDYDLCLLQKDSVALWMTYHTEPLRYVLAPDRCAGDTYNDLTYEGQSILNGAGLLPELPQASYHLLPTIIAGFVGVLGACLLLVSFIVRVMGRR